MSNETASKTNPVSLDDLIRGAGFALMLTWHYVVLFTPIFSSGYGYGGGSGYDLNNRQLMLYLSLALSFSLIALINPHIPKATKKLGDRPAAPVILGLVSTAVSILCIVPPIQTLAANNCFTIALGACEAIMMWFWLSRLFSSHHATDTLRFFSVNMIIAGVLSLLVCYLQGDVSRIVAAILPLASSIALLYEIKRIQAQAKTEKTGKRKEKKHVEESRELDWNQTFQSIREATADKQHPQKKQRRVNLASFPVGRIFTLSVIGIFGFVFGLLQGAFSSNDIYLLMVDRPLVLLGIVLAGLIVFAAPKKLGVLFGANVVHHYALVLVVIGITILFQTQLGTVALIAAEIAILAGFNLFDSSAMMLGIGSSLDRDEDLVHIAAYGGRPVVYCSLFIGLALGHFLAANSIFAVNTLTAICGIAIVLLVATTLFPYYSHNMSTTKNAMVETAIESKGPHSIDEILSSPLTSPTLSLEGGQESKKFKETPWRKTCAEIVKLYQLSPREAEVFTLLAKGRNVAYIQEKLVISPHTAKTHIANIYRKLEIHSSQDLLNLVESLCEAERHFSEDSTNGD